MKCTNIPIGTETASGVRESSQLCVLQRSRLLTVGDLLSNWQQEPPKAHAMLRTTCSLLSSYFERAPNEIPLDDVRECRVAFRTFLHHRKYKHNSIRSYVNYLSVVLKEARARGWIPYADLNEEWLTVLKVAPRYCAEIARHLTRVRRTPREVTTDDVESWVQMRVAQGIGHGYARKKSLRFWEVLRDLHLCDQVPTALLRTQRYGVPLDLFPITLKQEVQRLLNWKQAKFAVDRPKYGRHRAISAKYLRSLIGGLFGFVVNIRHEPPVTCLTQLVDKRTIGSYVEWLINERQVKGLSLQTRLGLLYGAINNHPDYSFIDFAWLKQLIENLPAEPDSELRKRKARKYLAYEVVESIPDLLRGGRGPALKKGRHRLAVLVMEELLMKWLTALPWRQRNVRECRIGGPNPNLFFEKIPPFSGIDKPRWILEAEQKDPNARFWQFRFDLEETKTEIEVQATLPRPLIEPLEEYLAEFRPVLVNGSDPGTLFLNSRGRPLSAAVVGDKVSTLTHRLGGRRVTPHIFRDIVAFAWLKEHPKDFLTLSKMLWHSNVNTTIKKYGSQFNESSGVCAMEEWMEDREKRSTSK